MASNGRSWAILCVATLVASGGACDGDVVGGTRQVEDDCTYGCEPERDDAGGVVDDDGEQAPEDDPDEDAEQEGEGGGGGASGES